ncbi:PREDICTED: zinc finger protein JAGGED-like [Tarenaya hassleriana]|uniref:zinc finger protein JAGGED-like n=1 Tax=Tarenaya hassleriana TaxID=28532 RepID=UPI0008FCEB92|nr:PREDICTED: zinc finger protein JAGGED-like [Tarenaya hassleriana]
MRNEENHLDLNNLPDDFPRDVIRQTFEEGSSSGQRKKKGVKDGKDEERETETLNQARQLVYRNDTLAPPGISPFGFPTTDPTLYYAPRLFPGGSSAAAILPPPPPPPPSFPFSSPIRLSSPYSSNQYSPHRSVDDYYLGQIFRHNLTSSQNPNPTQPTVRYRESSNYTCIGAPVGHSDLDVFSRDGNGSRPPLDPSRPPPPINRFQDHEAL